MRKRVLHILPSVNGGGISSWLVALLKNQCYANEVESEILCRWNGKGEQQYTKFLSELGIRIHLADNGNLTARELYFRLLNLIKDKKYDAVHAHLHYMNAIVLLAAKTAEVTIRASHSHTADPAPNNSVNRLVARPLIKYLSTHRIAVSEFASEALYGSERHGIVIMPCGIDPDRFIPVSELRKNEIRARYALQRTTIAVACIGRLEPPKNHHFLIEIADEAKRRQVNVKFLLFGKGSLEAELMRKVASLGLENVVSFCGYSGDIPEVLHACDVVCMPSFFEGSPVTAMEAQAAGTPIVMSESIDPRVAITGFASMLSLDESASSWLYAILSAAAQKTILKSHSDPRIAIANSEASLDSNAKILNRMYSGNLV